MRDFIQFLVTSLVKNPENVEIEESGEGTNFKYLVTVDPADMGLVIGKEGRTINSIRSLAKAKAVKEGIWVDVELLDYGRPAKSEDKPVGTVTQTEDSGGDENAVDRATNDPANLGEIPSQTENSSNNA